MRIEPGYRNAIVVLKGSTTTDGVPDSEAEEQPADPVKPTQPARDLSGGGGGASRLCGNRKADLDKIGQFSALRLSR